MRPGTKWKCGSLVQNVLKISRWWRQAIKPRVRPFWEWKSVGPRGSHAHEASPDHIRYLYSHTASQIRSKEYTETNWTFYFVLKLPFPPNTDFPYLGCNTLAKKTPISEVKISVASCYKTLMRLKHFCVDFLLWSQKVVISFCFFFFWLWVYCTENLKNVGEEKIFITHKMPSIRDNYHESLGMCPSKSRFLWIWTQEFV